LPSGISFEAKRSGQHDPAPAPPVNDDDHDRQYRAYYTRLLAKIDHILAIQLLLFEQGDKERAGISSPLEPGLMYLLRLVMRRYAQQYETGWREWLRELGHVLLSEVDGRSLLLAWLPWDGRAPPVVPALVQRQ
jgi:hypothetical protein